MAGINKAIVVGRVGGDPKINSLISGDKVASFSLATSESWKDKTTGDRKEKTEWHNIVIFNDNVVKIVEAYVKKGSLIGVDGQLQTRKWQDKSGADRYSTEIVITKFRGELSLLGSKDDNGGGERSNGDERRTTSKPKPVQDDLGPEDDIPF